jgi:two-component system chemotaxis sensor kinase CheA
MDMDFQKRLLATFKVETKEHLTALSTGLIALEKAAEDDKRQELLEAVFREAHSLKGAARAVNMTGIESLSHALESVFAKCKRQNCVPSPALFDLLHQTIDTIDKNLLHLGTDRDDFPGSRVRELILSLEQAAKGPSSSPPPAPPRVPCHESLSSEKPVASDTVRISAGKLDSLFQQTEEMLTAKLAALQRSAELGEICAAFALWEREWKKIRPTLRGLRKLQQSSSDLIFSKTVAGQLRKLLDFSESSHAAVKSVQIKANKLAKAAAGDLHFLESMVDTLLDDLKEVLMLPCATIFEVLPKMVRDLARDRGKDAELTVSGEAVEIDKRVLEELKDPLIHLVRNCVDHGIEKPEERQRGNKPVRGRITVAASLVDSGRIEILVSDDGTGIDTGRLAEVAIQQGIVARDEELLELIFKSGVSTASMITDISGRGLGLAIVREKVEKLGGTVTVVSKPLDGTTFRMVLPLTLSTCRGVLVSVGEQTFIVPSAGVEKVISGDVPFYLTNGPYSAIFLPCHVQPE